ncbi:MAG: hypothetical protein ACRDZM_02895, partial [Acidimicrobiia bacterium]
RLDTDEPVVIDNGGKATNAFTPEEGWFMIAGGDPNEPGCWEVEATYKGATLSYVYERTSSGVAALPEASDVPKSCPITVPGDVAFAPASQAPKALPSVYDAVWYGTPELWTMLNSKGEVWSNLPVGADGGLTQKWLWWSQDLTSDGPVEMIVMANHLDGSAPTVGARGSRGASSSPSSPSLGTFMVTGFELPELGCWEIAGHHGQAALRFVVSVPSD